MSETRSIICRQCQAELEVDEEYYRELQGREIECPECQAKVSVGKEPVQSAQPLSMNKQGLAGARMGSGKCPQCGAALDPEAVLCVACGTDLKTGQPLASGVEKGRRSGGHRVTRLLVGLLAVAVIAGAVTFMADQHRRRRAEEQSRLLVGAVAAARNAHNIEAALRRLEEALNEAPRARNQEEAQELIAVLRQEVKQVPERTLRLRAALDEAAPRSDLNERIALVAPVLETARGAADYQEAERLLREWRQAARLQSQLEAEMRRAGQAESPAAGVRILQAAIPRFGNAPNLPAAYRLLAELQRRAQAGD